VVHPACGRKRGPVAFRSRELPSKTKTEPRPQMERVKHGDGKEKEKGKSILRAGAGAGYDYDTGRNLLTSRCTHVRGKAQTAGQKLARTRVLVRGGALVLVKQAALKGKKGKGGYLKRILDFRVKDCARWA